MAEPHRESSVTPSIQNIEAVGRLQKVFSFDKGGVVQLHGAKIEIRGGVNIDAVKKGTTIETKGKDGAKKETNLVDFLQEDTTIQTFLEKAIEEDVLKPADLHAVKLPIASVTTGTETVQKLDLSKPLTNLQKAEAIGLILQNIGQGNLVEEIGGELNRKLKRTGKFATSPFRQMDYLNALTAAGGQALTQAIREADYRPNQITAPDATRRKVASEVTPSYESEEYSRELSDVTEEKGMNVFDEQGELQESASVDLKGAQLMFNLFLPSSELLAMNKLAIQTGRETDIAKRETLRSELVKKRQMAYIALLQTNGVKGYEANGPVVRDLLNKGALTAEEITTIQGSLKGKIEKNMKQKGLHEMSLHDANVESLVRLFSENYDTRRKGNVPDAVRNALGTIEISRDTVTKIEDELGQKGYSKSQRTRIAYERLWEQFGKALSQEGLSLKKGQTPQETADSQEALRQFFFDRIRTELGMTERKIKFENGFKNPSDVKLSEVEDWGLKGLDLLYRRTHSEKVYKDVADYDEKIRDLLQKMATHEEPTTEAGAHLVQEAPKKLDPAIEEKRITLEENLPKTGPLGDLQEKPATMLSQMLQEVISAELAIDQVPSQALLGAVRDLVTAQKPEVQKSADLLFRIVLGESVKTPAGQETINTLVPQVLEKLKNQPERLDEILDVLDALQQNTQTPEATAQKLGALIEKYQPPETPKPPTSLASDNTDGLDWLNNVSTASPTTVTSPSTAATPAAQTPTTGPLNTPPPTETPPPPPEIPPLTVAHGFLEVTKDANGIVIKQVKADNLTGDIFGDGKTEFAFTHNDVNAAIRYARENLWETLTSSSPDRQKSHNEGAVLDALIEFKKTETLQALEPHLAALGIDRKTVRTKPVFKENGDGKKEDIIVFEVAAPVTLPFSAATAEKIKQLNGAATASGNTEIHIAQLSLKAPEQPEENPVGLKLPAEVHTLVATDGAKGAIAIEKVKAVVLEGKSEILLTKPAEGTSSIGSIDVGAEASLLITPKLAQDLSGKQIYLRMENGGLDGYTVPGEYTVSIDDYNNVVLKSVLPAGGAMPQQPSTTTPPPPPDDDLDIPTFLRRQPSTTTPQPTPFSPPLTPTPAVQESHATAAVPPPERQPIIPSLALVENVIENLAKIEDTSSLYYTLETAAEILWKGSPEEQAQFVRKLNTLAQQKHRANEMGTFIENLLLTGKNVVNNFIETLDDYADLYNKSHKPSFIGMITNIIRQRATPVNRDLFGVDHIHLDIMMEELRQGVNKLTLEDYGEASLQDLVELLSSLNDDNVTVITAARALLRTTYEQYAEFQTDFVSGLEDTVANMDNEKVQQTIKLRNIVSHELKLSLLAYADKYNHNHKTLIKRHPFQTDFPELASLLLEENE